MLFLTNSLAFGLALWQVETRAFPRVRGQNQMEFHGLRPAQIRTYLIQAHVGHCKIVKSAICRLRWPYQELLSLIPVHCRCVKASQRSEFVHRAALWIVAIETLSSLCVYTRKTLHAWVMYSIPTVNSNLFWITQRQDECLLQMTGAWCFHRSD